MQPTELRIGNILYDPISQRYCQVSSINHEGNIRLFSRHTDSFNENINNANAPIPIPLTPEILLKVGAQKVEGTQCYKLAVGDIWIIVYPSGSIEIWNDVDTIKLNIDINQLHKFQNLVFDLTGKELNVDEVLK